MQKSMATSLKVLADAVRQGKEINGIQHGKERNKTVFVHRWHACLYRKHHRKNKNLQKLLSDNSKAAGDKINI